jgi:lipase
VSLEERAGIATYVQHWGHGAEPALMIHCSLAHSGAWAGVAARLSDKLTMTAFDLPGHGQSADWDGQGDYGRRAAEVAATFFTEPLHLIGHSFGAVTALRLALAAPEGVRSLTLIEPVLFAAARDHPEWETYVRDDSAIRAALDSGDRLGAARAFMAQWGTGAAWEDLPGRTRAQALARIHLIPAAEPLLRHDNAGLLSPSRLEQLSAPVMLICGTASPPVIARIAEVIAERLPDVGVAKVPGAGHMLPVTHPDQVAGLIEVNVTR